MRSSQAQTWLGLAFAGIIAHGGAANAMVELTPDELDRIVAGTSASADSVGFAGPALLVFGSVSGDASVVGAGGTASTDGLVFQLGPPGVDFGGTFASCLPPCSDFKPFGPGPAANAGQAWVDPATGPLSAGVDVFASASGTSASASAQATVTSDVGTNSAGASGEASGFAFGPNATFFGAVSAFAQN